MDPLANVLTKRQISDIFANLLDILHLSSRLLQDIEHSYQVASVFEQLAPFMKVYGTFAGNFRTSLSTIQNLSQYHPQFKSILHVIFRH
jgi:hypothetical protein